MNIDFKSSQLRTIRSTDKDFMLQDGLMVAPRAGFEIDINCPREYKLIIADCVERGWLRPVANVKDQEMFWEALSQ